MTHIYCDTNTGWANGYLSHLGRHLNLDTSCIAGEETTVCLFSGATHQNGPYYWQCGQTPLKLFQISFLELVLLYLLPSLLVSYQALNDRRRMTKLTGTLFTDFLWRGCSTGTLTSQGGFCIVTYSMCACLHHILLRSREKNMVEHIFGKWLPCDRDWLATWLIRSYCLHPAWHFCKVILSH